ncbi:protein of unknown function [Magnetospirillum sp. XM-1]|nr:protein of unknown function [Magnetospirillum sp. XM-1]
MYDIRFFRASKEIKDDIVDDDGFSL